MIYEFCTRILVYFVCRSFWDCNFTIEFILRQTSIVEIGGTRLE